MQAAEAAGSAGQLIVRGGGHLLQNETRLAGDAIFAPVLPELAHDKAELCK